MSTQTDNHKYRKVLQLKKVFLKTDNHKYRKVLQLKKVFLKKWV